VPDPEGAPRARKPAPVAVALALIPLTAMCLTVPLWDHIYPMPLGLPFNLFWLICWIVLTPLLMWGAYRIEAGRHRPDGTDP
jgi:hypothetical protein